MAAGMPGISLKGVKRKAGLGIDATAGSRLIHVDQPAAKAKNAAEAGRRASISLCSQMFDHALIAALTARSGGLRPWSLPYPVGRSKCVTRPIGRR